MYSPRTALATPTDYDFPYQPYDIQQQLMESLYTVLERKGIGIFESPTGTGKSLTLTCAALRWLLDHEDLVRQDLQHRIEELSSEIKQLAEDGAKATDWIEAQHKTMQRRAELNELQRLNALMQTYEQKLHEIVERRANMVDTKPVRGGAKRSGTLMIERDQKADDFGDVELQFDDFTEKQASSIEETEEESKATEELYKDVKIYFSSRTHSQLSQVVREVKRTVYGKRVRCVSLASRQQLCINPEVSRMPSVSLINERCLDLANSSDRSGKTSKATACDAEGCTQKKVRLEGSARCAYKTSAAIQELSETSLCKILDIEDLVVAGERAKACPYYAARVTTAYAQLVMLPYQMLLHRKTRLQSGIDLRHAVVIIDEAHNLLDTIAQIHSAEVTLHQLMVVQQQITAYKMRYASRFSTANLLKINQLNFIVKRLIKILTPPTSSSSSFSAATTQSSRMLLTHDLMSEGEFFNINVFHILEFCERTRFAQKLQGFAQRMHNEPKLSENQQPTVEEPAALSMLKKLQQEHIQHQAKRKKLPNSPATEVSPAGINEESKRVRDPHSASSIRPVLAFLETLTASAEDGRVLVNIDITGDTKLSGLKYLLLNPGEHFKDILQETRAIIIAGGTMQPTAELTLQLFKSCPERVVEKFYDHVVPADAVLPFVVAKGPTGKHFCFNYAQRSSPEMLSELGMTLQNLCCVIPAGVVCFFPSYDFLETAYTHLKQRGFLDGISQKKRLFREPRAVAAGQSLEQMLNEYASTIKHQGALLLSVVGGKLSEGLNFADDLGRCVIVVGMPYPNRKSPELLERMRYLDNSLGAGAGNEYYENLCMKAVNQCIGRSVRHIRDYASVMLLDERYSSKRLQGKLPPWILRNLQVPANFGLVQGATAKFFKGKKQI